MKKDSAKSDEREKPDPEGSGEEGTGQNSGDKGELRTGIVPHLVERATALRGQSIAHPRQSQ
ncbi:MAG: hypothetical protein EHM53_13465, partial [Methanoregulaceae archaeon]